MKITDVSTKVLCVRACVRVRVHVRVRVRVGGCDKDRVLKLEEKERAILNVKRLCELKRGLIVGQKLLLPKCCPLDRVPRTFIS